MTSSPTRAQDVKPAPPGLWRSLLGWLASLKVAVVLLVVLSAVLAVATFLEAKHGREWAQWFCYTSWWFMGLWAALGVNVIAAALVRFPWKLRHLGFLLTHFGVIVLMIGALQTCRSGIEGQVLFAEGDSVTSMVVKDRTQLTIATQGKQGRASAKYSFLGGPVPWSAGKVVDFPETGGVKVRVLKFYPQAQREAKWAADESAAGQPALQLALLGPGGKPVEEKWLSASQFGGEEYFGQVRCSLLPATSETLLKDFIEPPEAKKDSDGVLSMHYDGKMVRVDVRESLGKKIPLGDSGISVEIVDYIPDAAPGTAGKFVSRSNQPRNPLLNLLVYLPGEKEPVRQIAFAKLPLLNLDGVNGRELPVKFWYHHPAAQPPAGAEFMQTPDGKLFCRVFTEDATQSRGEVKEGGQIEIIPAVKFLVVKYLPHAREMIAFVPAESSAGKPAAEEAAALLEITADGVKHEVWLKRNDEQFGLQWIETAAGPLQLLLGYEDHPLGFSLKLHDFTRDMNPGGMGDASYASTVQLVDKSKLISPEDVDQRHEIKMNHPLTYGKLTFYQSSFNQMPDGREVSILSAAYDPGRPWKYLGSVMVCVGMLFVFYIPLGRGRKAAAAPVAEVEG